jgi:hypothetical protein
LATIFKRGQLGIETAAPWMRTIQVCTPTSQEVLEEMLHTDDGARVLSVFHGVELDHRDFLEELLNERSESRLDSTGHEVTSWNRITTSLPNDYRDCVRYAFVAMLAFTRGRPEVRVANPRPAPTPVPAPPTRYDFMQDELNRRLEHYW